MLMAKSPIDLSQLEVRFAGQGLSIFGALELDERHCAKGEGDFSGQYAMLIGNAGHAMWPFFSQSSEYSDGQKDPMNRWTKRIVSETMRDVVCEIRHPFDEPYWPFQRIACEAMNIQPSPLGILIHPDYGLWHAFRAIIIVNQNSSLALDIENMIHQVQKSFHPCDTCIQKPCLTSCPVSAFDGTGLDRSGCFTHLDSNSEPDCMTIGCGARNACPVGAAYKYENAQIEFHMKSYRGAD